MTYIEADAFGKLMPATGEPNRQGTVEPPEDEKQEDDNEDDGKESAEGQQEDDEQPPDVNHFDNDSAQV